jgi:hypothetical protein
MSWRRTPKNYNGTAVPTKEIKDMLTSILPNIAYKRDQQPQRIFEIWQETIGEKLAPMTQIDSFNDGILVVKVKNSTLHSLLCQHEKKRILKVLQEKLSKKNIRDIIFKIG